MFNKKAQDLSIGTLILIVLGIVVLVLLILGFSIGWENLMERIGIIQGSTLSDVAVACRTHVTTQNTFGYCRDFKKVTVGGKKEYVNCQDSRIEGSLEDTLECSGSPPIVEIKGASYTPRDLVEWQCYQLKAKNELKENTKVNGRTCPSSIVNL